jgi:rSAM/selenodomain-associated transferase 1
MNSEDNAPDNVALIVFARYPLPGKVKTRLAKTLGDERSADFYRACAEYVFQESAKIGTSIMRYLFYSENSDKDHIIEWTKGGFLYAAQGPGDLGERMRRAFRMVFDRGARKAVVIGTDVPDISASLLEEAVQALNNVDVVIGPSRDGGYYLLGTKRLHDEIFSDIEWGSDKVFTETMMHIEAKRLSVCRLPVLTDIDTEDDLRSWHASIQNHPLKEFAKDIFARV